MEVNHKVEEESSDLPRVPDERANKKKNDSPSISDISDDDSSSESSEAPKLPPKPVKPRRSRTSMLASFGSDINDAGKVSSVFTALDEREAAEQERKRQEKEAKRLKREKIRQERERKQMEREKNQRENESEQNIKSNDDTNDGSLPPIRDSHDTEQPKHAHKSDVPNGDVRSNVAPVKTEHADTNGELPRKKRKYVRKPKEEPEEGKEKKRRRKDSEDTKPRKKRRKDSDANAEEKDKEVTKKKRRRKESNGEEEKPKRRRKKNNNNTTEDRSEEEPKKKRRKRKKEDDVSNDKSDSTNSTKKTTRKRKPKRENSKKSEAENEKSESDNKATRASKDEDDESSDSGEEWTLIEEDLLPGDTLTIFSKQVFMETIKKHAKTAAARALDRGYGFPMVPYPKLKPKYRPRKGLYECFSQFATNNQIAMPAPPVKGRKDFRIPYGAEYASEHNAVPNIEEDDKRLNGSRKIQHPKKRLLSHLRSSSDGGKQIDLAHDEVDNFVKTNTAESM